MVRNMTEGQIFRHLLSYAVPTILGNLFQLTYNAMDSIIVGRFAGKNSLAAVGTANPIMNIVLFFIIGLCMGASVLMSEFYGAGDQRRLKREVSTTLVAGIVFTIGLSILFIFLARPILVLINTPAEVIGEAQAYLRIIFAGLIFTFLYNVYASALRSVGDSVTPVRCLIVAAVLNGVLDYVMVAVFHTGAAGAAAATVMAQACSAVMCMIYVYRRVDLLRVSRKEMHVDRGLLSRTIHYSWASAMQQAVLYMGKVGVQMTVNPLGVDAMATFNAVNRVDDFAYTPQQSIGQGITVFIAQNRGAGNETRVRKGLKEGLALEVAYGIAIGAVIFLCARFLMTLFVQEEEVQIISMGSHYLTTIAFCYILPAVTNGIQGFFRGLGRMEVTLGATATQMIFRVLFSWYLAPRYGIPGIAYACLGGWLMMLVFEVPILVKQLRGKCCGKA